jgi:acyl carrier protein
MTPESTLPKLFEFFNGLAQDGGQARDVAADTPLLSSGVLDSLNLFMFISFIEDELGIAVEPDDVVPENFENLNAVCDLLARSEREPAA